MMKREVILFYAARALGLVIKPLTLWWLVRMQASDASYFVATYYFLVAATFIALNSEAHIPFYKLRFGGSENDVARRGVAFRSYIRTFSGHVYVFLPLVAIGFFLYLGSAAEAAAFTIFVLLEKLWDELQRSLIFSRRYAEWSFWFIVKMLLPAIAIFVSYWQGWNMLISLSLILLATGLVMVKNLVSAREARVIAHAAKRAFCIKFGEYLQIYRLRFAIAQILAVASVNLLNVDKWLVGAVGMEKLMVDLVLMAQVGTIYLVLMDNIFFSRSRDVYVLSKGHLSEIVNWTRLLLVSAGYLMSALLVLSLFREQLGILQLSFAQSAVVVMCFVSVGVTRPLTEHAFWHSPRWHSAVIDCFAIILMLGIGYLALNAGGLLLMLCINLVVIGLRFLSYIFICQKTIESAGKVYPMKIRNVGESVVLVYALATYFPQFLFHMIDESALSEHFRIGDGTSVYASLILMFFMLVITLNRLIPDISLSWMGGVGGLGRIFTSPILVSMICIASLVVAVNFYVTQSIGFRQTERLTSSAFAVALFFIKPYIYAWMLYHYHAALTVSADSPPLTRICAFGFLATLAMGVTSSLEMIPIMWLALFALSSRRFLRKRFLHIDDGRPFAMSRLLTSIFILPPLLIMAAVGMISIGYFNKYGVDGTFALFADIGIGNVLQQLMTRLSSSYASAISFSVFNMFNFDLNATSFLVPFENLAYRFSLIFSPDSPLARPEITQISRLNYLNYENDTSLPNAGASPGLVGSAFFAAPFPLGFLLTAVYVIVIIRLIDSAQRMISEMKRIWVVIFMTSMTFPLFESPVDYIDFIDPSFLYLALYVTALLAIANRHTNRPLP